MKNGLIDYKQNHVQIMKITTIIKFLIMIILKVLQKKICKITKDLVWIICGIEVMDMVGMVISSQIQIIITIMVHQIHHM